MTRRIINIGLGKTRSVKPGSPSEAGYVASVNKQMKAVSDAIIAVFDAFEDITPQVMLDAMQPTAELAATYCPKDTGVLVQSEYLEITQFRGHPRVELGFARGGFPSYAIYVHEMMDYQHEFPTRSKFLEAAVMEDLGAIYERLASEYEEAFRGIQ